MKFLSTRLAAFKNAAMARLGRRLPGSQRAPEGMERVVWRKLPGIALMGTLVVGLYPLQLRLLPPEQPADLLAKMIQSADILAIAAVVLHWTVVFTVAIGCVIVRVMKGPAYVADAYPLQDRDRPAP
jgi:hypothetical protein